MRPFTPLRPQAGCPHRRLRRLLGDRLKPAFIVADSGLRDWASANFTGARHHFICCAVSGRTPPPRAALHRDLLAVEWRVAGHIVADLTVEGGDGNQPWRIEILTVAD